MCGIAGVVGPGARDADIRAMAHAQSHRGPDADGFFADEGVALAHRRLSILDLSESGRQPMRNRDGSLWIVFNGEIYNYLELRDELGGEYATGTDTEVILRAYEKWGPRCVDRFIGMFAFAIWDARAKRLFCARDHLGVKPFHYWMRPDGTLFFASEIKGLLAAGAPREPDGQAIHDYLVYGYLDHSEHTFFAGISNLQPGHLLTWVDGKLSIEAYWRLEDQIPQKADSDHAALVERSRELIIDSIRLQMRSDVPVGVCLSGGLDSSTIASVVTKELGATNMNSFSAVYRDRGVDEHEYMVKVRKDTGVVPHETTPTAEDLLRDLTALLWHQEEPVGGTSIFAQWGVMRLVRDRGVKVLLDGQGADELFGGYLVFFGAALADDLKRLRLLRVARSIKALRALHGVTWGNIARFTLFATFPARARDRVIKRYAIRWIDPEFGARWQGPAPVRPFRSTLDNYLFEKLTRGLPALLHYEDRNSMAFSVEARVPFLDHRLVELAFALPPELKIDRGVTKVVLREAMRGILVEDVRSRLSKIGFATPEATWMRGPLLKLVEETLRSESFARRGYVDVARVLAAFEDHAAGRADHQDMLWRCVNLELWMRLFIDPAGFPRDPPYGPGIIGAKASATAGGIQA